MKQLLRLHVNGETHEFWTAVHRTLLETLREDLRLTGTKHGCELGECGSCTVLVDGRPVLSCLTLAVTAQNKAITTIEGLAAPDGLHPLQAAFVELGAAQCGYCTPGMLMSAKAFLDGRLDSQQTLPSRQEIRAALAGNLCRCTGYLKIIEAVELAAQRLADAAPVAR